MVGLKRLESAPAQGLLRVLDFEFRAVERAAESHPLMIAFSRLIERIPSSAMIVLVSHLNHDAEAVQFATETLSRRELAVIPLGGIK